MTSITKAKEHTSGREADISLDSESGMQAYLPELGEIDALLDQEFGDRADALAGLDWDRSGLAIADGPLGMQEAHSLRTSNPLDCSSVAQHSLGTTMPTDCGPAEAYSQPTSSPLDCRSVAQHSLGTTMPTDCGPAEAHSLRTSSPPDCSSVA